MTLRLEPTLVILEDFLQLDRSRPKLALFIRIVSLAACLGVFLRPLRLIIHPAHLRTTTEDIPVYFTRVA